MPDKLYYPIGEVAQMLNVNPSLLLESTRNKKGTRYYTESDIALLRHIYHLTRDCGYTLDGVKEQLRLNNNTLDDRIQIAQTLNDAKQFLLTLKDYL